MNSIKRRRKFFSLLTTVSLLLIVPSSATRAQSLDAQSQRANENRILLTAVDKSEQFVTTLRAEDLRVTVDGRPQQIAAFNLVTDRAIALAIVIDVSASQEHTL